MRTIALVGNPNTGKTTFFNNATKQNYHIGNWHGVTIDPICHKVVNQDIELIDLAGTYSLNAFSLEEKITSNFILQNFLPIYNICEQDNLRRNLILTLQLLELNNDVTIVINNFGKSDKYDYNKLSSIIGCQIKVINFFKKKEVLNSFNETAKNLNTLNLDYLQKLPIKQIVTILNKYEIDLSKIQSESIKQHPKEKLFCTKDCINKEICNQKYLSFQKLNKSDKTYLDKFVALRILEGNEYYISLYNLSSKDKESIQQLVNEDCVEKIYALRYKKIDELLTQCIYKEKQVVVNNGENQKQTKIVKDKFNIDKILLNKYLALPIFLLIILFVFYITFGAFGSFCSDKLEWLLETVSIPIIRMIDNIGVQFIYSLFVDGIMGGVGSIVSFLPQVLLLFMFLTILEESGYMSRLAYLLEGVCNKIGLSGKSVFTFLMGYGCTATALLTAENLDNANARLKTILTTPYMACSAKLPVFAVLGGAFFGANNVLIIFGLYILSAVIGLIIVNILDKTLLPNKQNSFLLEFPPYRVPKIKIVIKSVFKNMWQFIVRVASYILIFSILIWFLQSFTISFHYINDENEISILQRISQVLAPIFTPLGFGEWGAVSALLAGLIAKELIVSSIGIINNVGVGDINDLVGLSVLSATSVIHFDSISVLSFLTFCLLYTPCVATISSMRSIIGNKWTIFSVCMQFCVAYITSYFVYKIAQLFASYSIFASIFIIIVIILLCITILKVINYFLSKRSCSYNS